MLVEVKIQFCHEIFKDPVNSHTVRTVKDDIPKSNEDKLSSKHLSASKKTSETMILPGVYTECKYGGSLGRPGSSCAKARLVRHHWLS